MLILNLFYEINVHHAVKGTVASGTQCSKQDFSTNEVAWRRQFAHCSVAPKEPLTLPQAVQPEQPFSQVLSIHPWCE